MVELLLLKKGKYLNFTLTFIAYFFFLATGWGQTVKSDKADYAPGETAIITGTGWAGDTIVKVHFNETPVVDHIHDYHYTPIDANGNFVINFPILERHLGVSFEVEVVGQTTGRIALAYFTDAHSISGISPNSGTTLGGTEVTISGSGFGNSFSWQVQFGNSLPVNARRENGSTLIVSTPPHIAGSVNVTVIPVGNAARATAENGYTYISPQSSTTLAVQSASGIYGGTTNLSATLTSNSAAVSGKTIAFSLNGNSVGSAVTNASGVATLNNISLAGINAAAYANGVSATFVGDATHSTSSGIASLTVNKAATTTVVTINGGPFTYDGTAQTPATVSVTGVNGLNLTPAADYANNINAGTATASYTYAGDDNYNTSSDSETFTIGKAATTTVVTINGGPFTYDGTAQTPATVSVTGANGLNLTPAADYANNINAGTATASYTYAGDDNYNTSSDSETFTIGKAATTTVVTINGGPFTYDGTAKTPATVSVTGANGLNLTPVADYANNINAGTATAGYTYAGDDNYITSSDSKTFAIGKAATTTVVTINGGPFTYDGTAQTPATVSVTGANGLNLTPVADYANNINAGTATASYTYAETANYLGSSDSEDFTIGKAATTTVVTINGGPFTYDGTAQTPATVSVTGAGGLDLTPDALYSNNVNAGTATASYTYAETANYLGSSDSEDFTIGKAATTTVVTINGGPFTYDGTAQTPATVSVTGANGLNLAPAADYANNINAGTATASYTYAGDDNYNTSSDSETFTIGKAATTTVVTINGGPFTYDGTAQTPATVSVTGVNGLNLTPAADYANNINAGTATASYTYAGDDNYNTSSDSETFTIGKAATTTVVTINGGPFTYDGTAQTPATVSVTGANGLNLAPAADYANNINAGTATASYTYAGDDNYNTSSDSETFTIGKAATTTVVTINGGPFTYDGTAQTPATVSVTGVNGLNLTPAADYANNINAGTATASYTYAGDDNYNTSSDSETFTIGKAATTTVVTINGGPFTYDGTAQTPATVSVTGVNGLNLTPAADYANNINAGTATASYTYAGDDNYNTSSDSETFTIGKAATTTVVTINGGPFTYDGTAQTPATVSVTGANGLNLTPAADYANNINAGTATASYTYAGDDNYNTSSDSETFTIGKAATTTVVTINGGPFTYDGTAKTPATVSVTGANGLNLTPVADYANNINAGTATAGYTYAGDDNYITSSDSKTFAIGKAATTTVVTINGGPFTYDGTAQTPATVSVTGAGGLNLTPAADYANNINAGTATASYTYAGDDNHNTSSDSEIFTIGKVALVITTKSSSKFAGQVNPQFEGSYNNFVTGEDEGVLIGEMVFTTVADINSCAGTYNVIPSGLTSINYTINFVPGKLTVNPVIVDARYSNTSVQLNSPDGVVLSATVSSTIPGNIKDILVKFLVDGVQVGTGETDESGIATFTYTALSITAVKEVSTVIGDECAKDNAYLSIYDPNGGFVTGGGWIESPANAMDSGFGGKANFGFNAKYKSGKNTLNEVDGNTNFQFKAGDFHFSSTSHTAAELIISGSKATYTGRGTVNGTGDYNFRVVAIDGALTGNGAEDKFRIKIWADGSQNNPIYDNQRGKSESGEDATIIGGGSIVIHKPKGGGKTAETTQTLTLEKGTVELTKEPVNLDILGNLAVAPNPVRTDAKVRFSLIEDAEVTVRLFDFNGREIYNLYSGNAKANEVYEVGFQRNNMMSGIYIVRLTTDRGQSYTKQVIVE